MFPSQGIGKIPVSPEHMKARLTQVEAEIILKQERVDSLLERDKAERDFTEQLARANGIQVRIFLTAMKRHAEAEANLLRVDVARAQMEANILKAAIEEAEKGSTGLFVPGGGLA